MQIVINTSEILPIDWGATGVSEVAQNVYNLINTFKYEVAYDRTLGLRPDFLDLPPAEAISLATAQIYAVIEERELRAVVQEVKFLNLDVNGNLNFQVVIDV